MEKFSKLKKIALSLSMVLFLPFCITDTRAVSILKADISDANEPLDPSDLLFETLTERVRANQQNFFVYLDSDSGFNHGFPSGLFPPEQGNKIHLDTACIDDPSSANGCSTSANALDCERGNVLRITFDPLSLSEFAGVNIEEPENWGGHQTGKGYDLTSATLVKFDVRSPDSAKVQFGVGGCVTDFISVSSNWTSISLSLDSAFSCTPDLTNAHLLFTVVTNSQNAPNGATVLLDNIRFEPALASRNNALGLPLSTRTCGVIPLDEINSGRNPYPPDQVNRNVATIYEAALVLKALLARSRSEDIEDAHLIAEAIHYALHNDNSGARLPETPDGDRGLHNAYMGGDIALYNDQAAGDGKSGEVRLTGFSSLACSPSNFCLSLDGATGGNNAFVILALAAAYRQFNDQRYIEDALTIGNWIHDYLKDRTGTGYGGYYLGYRDEGIYPKLLQKGKSVENNADIFSAFLELADLERGQGHYPHAVEWTDRAYVAGDFVMAMFDDGEGRFYAGTAPVGTLQGTGIDPSGAQKGDDVINVFDFLDSSTFSFLSLASFPRYHDRIDWRRPIQHVLDTFAQSIKIGDQVYQGFNLVQIPTHGPNGIAWEFTAQAVVAMQFAAHLYRDTRFEDIADFYLDQVRQAQRLAPFGDQRGLVASTLQEGDILAPIEHCLSTPFQCIPQRVGLAATTWAIFAEGHINPFPATTIRYVNWATGNDNNDCSDPESPCATMGRALSRAEYFDTILVAAGSYLENLSISKAVTLKGGYDDSDWSRCLRRHATTIDGTQGGRAVIIQETFPATTVIDGFTMTNGKGGISIFRSSVDIHNCIIVQNHTDVSDGGGILIDRSLVSITNTIVADNSANHDGAIRIISTISEPGPASRVDINHATIVNNRAMDRDGILCSLSACDIRNSIIWGHNDEDISGLGWNATYSNIEMGHSDVGNISQDPGFLDPAQGDYHLRCDSPCIDTGINENSPGRDFEDDPRPVDGNFDGNLTVDMGADEFMIHCQADFDNDGNVDGVDMIAFIENCFQAECCDGGPIQLERDIANDCDDPICDLATFAADFGRTDCRFCPDF